MTDVSNAEAIATARDYYNSEDADNFYYLVWGGEDLHIGIYESANDSIAAASTRTVARMAELCPNLDAAAKVLDIGAGYGGSARYLARHYGCHVDALNLSEKENERDRQKNKEQGLEHLVEVYDGSFESLPFADASYDVVWSQDAILHSPARAQVLAEVARVLRPGGYFVFTDPMQADDCPADVLQPIYDRIHLSSLGSPSFYRQTAKALGMEEVGFESHASQLPFHYGQVLAEFNRRADELASSISTEYSERMRRGLQHWVDGGNNGYLTWGIFRFRKA